MSLHRCNQESHVNTVGNVLDVYALSQRTLVEVIRVDLLLGGKALRFHEVKRRFDGPDPQALALLCFGNFEKFLVGTDLAHADSMVSVGHIGDHLLVQAMGRVFRPLRGRDPNKAIELYKIYVH